MAVVKNLMVRAGADFSSMAKGINIGKNSLNKLQNSVKSSMNSISRNTRTINNSFSAMQSSVSSSIGRIKNVLVTLGIGALVKESVSSAMQVESSVQQISRIMGANSQEFLNWAKTQAYAYNMSKSEALKYGSTYGNLINGFSKSTGETMKYTQDLLKASAVVASGTGRTMEDVMDRIRSGMLGSTESIEDLGINVNIAMIESTDAFKKFANGKSWQKLSFQTQQQIRLFAILEQSSKKYGDSINENTASAQQQFVATLKNVQLTLGQAFLPIYNAVLPALTSLANSINNVITVFAQFTQALFGKSKASAASTQAQATAVNKLGEAYADAGNAAKGSTAGFDEVNVLAEKTSAGASATAVAANSGNASAGAGTGATAIDFSTNAPEISLKVQDMANAIKSKFEEIKNSFNIDFSNIQNALDGLKTALAPFAETIGNGLFWFFENVLVPLGNWTMNKVVPLFLDILSGALDVLNSTLEALKPLGAWLWNNFLQPIAKWTGGVITDVLGKIGDSLIVIGDWIKAHKPVVEALAIVIGSFALSWWLVNAAVTAWNVIAGVASVITTALGTAIAFLTSPIGLVIAAIGAVIAIVVLLIRHWDDVKKAATVAWDKIVDVWNVVANWFQTKVIKPISDFFSGLWNGVKNTASAAWNGVSKIWNTVSNWFRDKVVTPISKAFTSVWDGIKDGFSKAFDFILTGIRAYINLYITIVEGLANAFIKGINFIIKALNMIKFDIPDWVPIIGGKKFGINLGTVNEISIPRLAEGGITNGPMMAMIGDNPGGQEVVAPLDSLTDIIASAVSTAMLSAMQFLQSQNGTGGKKELVMNIDGTRFARVILPDLEKEATRTGSVILRGV